MSYSVRPHRRQPIRLHHPWDALGKNTGVGCHCLLQKKCLRDPKNHNGVVTHLESDILESEVRWALGSITTNKAGGGDEIPAEQFQVLKDDAVKVLHSIGQQIRKTQRGHRTGKCQFSFQSQRRAMTMFKLLHNCTHFTCCCC